MKKSLVVSGSSLKKIDNDSVRSKARLVVKGYSEIEGIHFHETFSPVVRYSTLRFLFAYAVENGFKINDFDVITAFLQGEIDETIFMDISEAKTGGKVAKLNRSLYGLHQSSRIWYKKFSDTMVNKSGFKVHDYEPCVFIKKDIMLHSSWMVSAYFTRMKKNFTH